MNRHEQKHRSRNRARIAVLTPMSPNSTIADATLLALEQLRSKWDVTIYTPGPGDIRETSIPVMRFDEVSESFISELSGFDLVVYVIGNSPFHRHMIPLAGRVPGLMVLHEVAIADLVRWERKFGGLAGIATGTPVVSTGAAPSSTGGTTTGSVDSTGAAPNSTGDTTTGTGMEFFPTARGAMVHSRWHADLASSHFSPVTVAPLVVPSEVGFFDTSNDAHIRSLLANLPVTSDLVITLGSVNANRAIDRILKALSHPALKSVVLWAVGFADPDTEAALHDLAVELGVSARFEMPGPISNELLPEVLARADIAVAFRTPVFEGSSGSVLTQMGAGLVVVVMDHAHYSELPDDAVVKVRPDVEPDELATVLAELLADPQRRQQIGENARRRVAEYYNADNYAAALETAIELALRDNGKMAAKCNRRSWIARLRSRISRTF